MKDLALESIKFNTIPIQRRIEKPWGYEIIYTPEGAPFTGKILFVKKGSRLSLQYHDEKKETLCLFSGKALISLDDKDRKLKDIEMELQKGYYIRPGQRHRVTAIKDSFLIEASVPEIGNTVRIEDDFSRSTETEEMRKLKNRGWKPK